MYGNGPKQAATDFQKVTDEGEAETKLGKAGAMVGSLFTPESLATSAIGGQLFEGLGPVVSNMLKGWGEDAATFAVGKIKTLAKSLNVADVDALGEFLLKPITIGSKTFEPIVQATSSPKEMLAAAQKALQAVGKELGNAAQSADEAIGQDVSKFDWEGLLQKISALKEEAVGDIEEMAPGLAKQFDGAIASLQRFVTEQMQGVTDTAFSDLSAIKTKIGGLVFKHGSPLESKAALNDIYHAVNDALVEAAKNTGEKTGAAYLQMNDLYHKLISVVEGLEGKTIDAKNWFNVPTIVSGLATAAATHGPLALATVPTAILGTKLATTYAPQMIAKGLNVAAPFVGRAIPAAARLGGASAGAISSALANK
jgi:hypothetical protein